MRRALLLILLSIPTFFVFLGSAAITDSDEAYYAEASREMIESGDWITPRFNYELRFEKPILFYWMVAATYAVAGVSEGAARFWAAMSGVGLVMVAYATGRRWIDDDAGFLGGAITATSFAAAAMARQSLPDLPLAFFITLAVWAGFEALAPAQAPPGRWSPRRWLLLSSAACALAALTKGPVGLALPVLIVGSAVVLEYFFGATPRRAPADSTAGPSARIRLVRTDRRPLVRGGHLGPWFRLPLPLLRRREPGPLRHGTLQRSAAVLVLHSNPHRRPAAVVDLRLPLAAAAECADLGRIGNSATRIRLIMWAVVPLAIFSVSVGKQPRYILPCLVPLAILLGSTISSRVRASASAARDVPLTIAGVLAGAVLLTVGVLLFRAAPLVTAAGGGGTAPWSILVVTCALAVILVAVQRSARLLPATLAVSSALTLLSLYGAVLASPGAEPVMVAAQALTRGGTPELRVCACGAFLRNLPFYVRSRIVPAGTQEEVNAALSADAPTTAAIDVRKLADAETALSRRFERLAEIPYLNTALLRIDDFLYPDPERALQRVVIIRTR